MDKHNILRIIDANLNRSREGLRVCEDIARFLLDDAKSASKFKAIRQGIFSAIKNSNIHYAELLKERNSVRDVGIATTRREAARRNWQSVFLANIERVKESTRVLEEIFKLINKRIALRFKNIRFSVYDIEKKIIIKHQSLSNSKHNRLQAY